MMTTPTAAPALVVIGSGTAAPHRADRHHSRAAHDKLLASLPAASRVLAWGRASVQADYCARHPACSWHQTATTGGLDATGGPFDLIVLTDGLDQLDDPVAELSALRRHAHARTLLALAAPHEPSLDQLRRWVEADLTALDATDREPNTWSLASTTKLLMDAGWMPTVADAVIDAPRDEPFTQAAIQLAAAAGVPATTARRHWGLRHAIVHAQATFEPLETPAQPDPAGANFAVVVPTTRETQLRLNVEASPGLREVDARVISVRRAASPADALARAREHVNEDWVLLCHQDVYFAPSFGHRLAALLDAVPAEERRRTLIGFAGIGVNREREAYEQAGFVIDRGHRFDRPASDAAVSIDELALVLPRESLLQIDPALGWHLWATDLCLQAICTQRFFPRIVRLPLFHNSLTDYTLPAAFHDSARVLAAKHPEFGPIHTLCGVIDQAFLARARSVRA